MSGYAWYFVDRTQQRRGPVTAEEVAAAYASGDASDTSLVWREGLPEWMPLAGFRDELGLAATARGAPAASASASPVPVVVPTTPVPPAKSGSGCLIAAIVGGVVLLVLLGILAAIALPAYQDYVERAEALAEEAAAGEDTEEYPSTEDYPSTDTVEPADPGVPGNAMLEAALAEARLYQGLVDQFVANTDRCPRDGSEVAAPPVVSPGVVAITVGEARTGMCTIEILLGGEDMGSLSDERLTLSRDSAGDWYCTSGIADRDALPADCR